MKLLSEAGEVYVLAESRDRVNKERAMRRRQMKALRDRLKKLTQMKPKRDELLMKLGAARQQSPMAWRFFEVRVAKAARARKPKESAASASAPVPEFSWQLNWDKLRQARRREGRYLLRSNMPERASSELWDA